MKQALLRLEKVFGRVQSPWLPASGNETYEIVRRRLFQALDAEGERARDETVKAFADLYPPQFGRVPARSEGGALPRTAVLSYPIHPELFDRLAKDWSSLVLREDGKTQGRFHRVFAVLDDPTTIDEA